MKIAQTVKAGKEKNDLDKRIIVLEKQAKKLEL